MRLSSCLALLCCVALPLAAVPEAAELPAAGDETAQGVFGYLARVAADRPLPPYTIVEIAHASARPSTLGRDAAWTVVLSAGPVAVGCAGADQEAPREPCVVLTLARDGRVLAGEWHGHGPYAFRTGTMRGDVALADGRLSGTLRTVDETEFAPDSAVINVRLDVPCPACK